MKNKIEMKKRYRPEIEGLRIVAALLVAIYHIWMMKVSGGVDVFFVVSGFLISTSLISRYARDGYINFSTFILGLLKRLLPNALLVLIFVTLAGYFILPEMRHSDTLKEIVASLFYYENWQLAIIGTDYLDQTNEKSPTQHFWAMSIQGQFYIIWFFIISLSIFLHRKLNYNFNRIFFLVLILLFTTSLSFSVYLTAVNQPWAYFDTRTRAWEFAVGGLLLLFIFKVRLPSFISMLIGWLGLIGLISTGMLLDVEGSFPGYVALWPVIAAVFVMVAGQNPTRMGVEKILGSKVMVAMGGLSYGLYLWHWPLLSFYYVLFDTRDVSATHGILIILLSLGLSYLTTSFVEKPVNKYVVANNFTLKAFRPILLMIVTLILFISIWFSFNQYESIKVSDSMSSSDYPGAIVNLEVFKDDSFKENEPIPNIRDIKNDKAKPYFDGCHQDQGKEEVIICEYGDTENYEYTIALIGGSKSAHWLPALETFAKKDKIRILSVTKSGCRFTLDPTGAADCDEWNNNVVAKVADETPDMAIVLADTAGADNDKISGGFLKQFERLNDRGIQILGIRDTPYIRYDVPECLSENKKEYCKVDAKEVLASPAAWDNTEDVPDYIYYKDYTEYICSDGECPSIIGNIIVYIDSTHMSATFSESFGPIIKKDVMEILESE